MKKHLLALLSVGSLVAMLPGCGSCCENKGRTTTTETSTESSSEVDAVASEVTEVQPAQDAVAPEAAPTAEDKH